MRLSELLSLQPPPLAIPDARARIRKALITSGKRLVVIDDDPTGMQTVQEVGIYMDWSVATLRKAIALGSPVFFVSINSRSLSPDKATALALEVGRNLREAARLEHAQLLLASRSDSTLRGHFPHEVEALVEGMGLKPDGIILAPAFFEAGRYTIDGMHWAEQDNDLVPVHQTEFARDPVFRFNNSNLKAWIVEKTKGVIKAEDVRSLPMKLLRVSGPEAITQELLKAANGVPIVVDGACYEDYEILCLGIQRAEEKGKKFVYRCSASFVKTRGGFEDRPLLTRNEMVKDNQPGLVVVGSYVQKTTRQLQQIFDSRLAVGIELRVDQLEERAAKESEIQRVATNLDNELSHGATVVLYTSRKLLMSGQDFAEASVSVMQALCEAINRVHIRPGYVLVKGGTTSIEVAKTALGVREAFALGQILPGVPVWRLGVESRWPGIAYIVFPGNVGDDMALVRAISTLNTA